MFLVSALKPMWTRERVTGWGQTWSAVSPVVLVLEGGVGSTLNGKLDCSSQQWSCQRVTYREHCMLLLISSSVCIKVACMCIVLL